MQEPEDSRSIGTLLGDLGRQVSTLVRKEIDLARVEITSGLSRMGRGAAMTAGGGALIYAGLLVVLIAIVLLLIDAGLDPWLAALIVGAVALAIGAARDLDGRAADPRHGDRPEADGRDGSRERRVRQGAGEMTTERDDDPLDGDIDDAEAGSLTDEEQAEAADIRADIEETREEMGGTLNELGDRLEPGHLMNQAKDNVRDATIGRVEETARGMSDMVMDTIKRNPIPAALAGAGLALLWINRSNGTHARARPVSVRRLQRDRSNVGRR